AECTHGDWHLCPLKQRSAHFSKSRDACWSIGSQRPSVQLALCVHGPAVDQFTIGVRDDQLVEAVDDRADMIGYDGHALADGRSRAVFGQLQESVVLVQG